MTTIHGIHHITAIASDPQRCYDFYSKILGLRLVKKTVNQDDVSTYHLFFGDKSGSPGMDLTFFTFQPAYQGRRGTGLVTNISLTVSEDSLDFWKKRFETKKVKHEKILEKFGRKTLVFYDGDDQKLELVGLEEDESEATDVWSTKEVSKENAIRSFHSATLTVTSLQLIEPVLLTLGYKKIGTEDQEFLYQLPGGTKAAYLIVDETPDQENGMNMAGTVHHIAFQVNDEKEELEMRQNIIELGLYPTEVINRFYFKSVYFRTPAGILFELATMGPGFVADEKETELGKKLALPPFLEDQRSEIEAGLTEIEI